MPEDHKERKQGKGQIYILTVVFEEEFSTRQIIFLSRLSKYKYAALALVVVFGRMQKALNFGSSHHLIRFF